MDDSQSSDSFLNSGMSLCNPSAIDIESYHVLFDKIKTSTCLNVSSKNPRLAQEFSLFLDDCGNCVDQSFDIIISLLEDPEIEIERVYVYIENAVHILQKLSNFIKNVIQVITVTCNVMSTFPTYTGNIISLVFSHCKDSESIYGIQLNSVEKQLKELFRSCHELQLTYLMTLEKHFLFDLSVKEEQDVLLETLNINLKIGELVQSLDVKTMAEQWKAYTALCDKYSFFILDKSIYNECTKLLASTIKNNLKTALEAAERDKVVIRSLKVASFSLKVLSKISAIFKGGEKNEYEHIIHLVINLCTSICHELTLKKSPQFTDLLYEQLLTPSDFLVSQIVDEEKFIENVLSTNISDNKDLNLLGYLLLLASIIKALTQKYSNINKNKLIEHLHIVLRKSHIWFKKGLKFKILGSQVQYGLYEYLFVHTIALAATMTCDEYVDLEKTLFEAVMGAEYYSAVFAVNMWVSLCRLDSEHLQINTLQNLLHVYQTLETHSAFGTSPQKKYLNYIIEKIFESIKCPDKIYKKFSLQEDKNIGIWYAMKIQNLPENLQANAEIIITDKLIKNDEYDVEKLTKCMDVVSTCTFVENNSRIEDFIVSAWSNICTDCNTIYVLNIKLDNNSLGYCMYMNSLIRITRSYKCRFRKNTMAKIIHAISSILQFSNKEMVLMFEIFCELVHQNQHETNVELFTNIMKKCIERSREQIFNIFISNKNIHDFVFPILQKEPSLIEIRNSFMKYEAQHECAVDHKYFNDTLNVKTKHNFDIDFDSLFEDEPVSKKRKIESNIEEIINNLEINSEQLSQVKENIRSDEYKNRIRNVCEKLII